MAASQIFKSSLHDQPNISFIDYSKNQKSSQIHIVKKNVASQIMFTVLLLFSPLLMRAYPQNGPLAVTP